MQLRPHQLYRPFNADQLQPLNRFRDSVRFNAQFEEQ